MSTDVRQVRERVTAELHQRGGQESAVSELARHKDPSLAGTSGSAQTLSRQWAGLQWVNVSEVLQRHGTRVADWHARGQENLIRSMRHGMTRAAVARRGVVRKASLPPVSAFGDSVPVVTGEAVAA